jgi:glycosyltransferase involved in cell wall biosynthesis
MGLSNMISVVMGVHNGEKYLDEAVQSIRRQTFGDFDFIIVDDGSTDGTSEILARHAAEDPRVRILKQPNMGLSGALNRALAEAAGEFIARMDADDISLPDRFEKQVGFLRAHPEIAAVGSASQFLQEDVLLDAYARPPLQHQAIMAILHECNPIVHPSMLIRRHALEAVGYYRPLVVAAEDLDLWLRLGERFQIANLEDVLIYCRKHAEQISIAKVALQTLSSLAAHYAGRIRQETGRDPIARLAEINPRSLMSIGVSPAEIEEALLQGTHRVNVLIKRGEFTKARRVLDDLDGYLADFPSSRQARSRIALLRSKSYREEHKALPRLFWGVRGYQLNPSRFRLKAESLVNQLRHDKAAAVR